MLTLETYISAHTFWCDLNGQGDIRNGLTEKISDQMLYKIYVFEFGIDVFATENVDVDHRDIDPMVG